MPTHQITNAVLIAVAFMSCAAILQTAAAQEIIGTHVTPHQFSSEIKYRKPPNPELSAKTELYLRNNSDKPLLLSRDNSIKFDQQTAEQLLADSQWAWYSTPDAWPNDADSLPPECLAVLTINGMTAAWGVGTKHTLQLGQDDLAPQEFAIEAPTAWLSAVTFLSADSAPTDQQSIYPDRIVVHICNSADDALQIRALRLWTAQDGESHRVYCAGEVIDELNCFPESGVVRAGDKGGFTLDCDPLPLTEAVVEVRVQRRGRAEQSLWSQLRIKREVFDISGGWVASDVNGRNSLLIDQYQQTLQRMHINTGHIEEVGGFTDDPQQYAKLPLKRFSRLWPLSRYDTDQLLPTIHAVEFLGEPQYGGGKPVPPQEIWQKLAPIGPVACPHRSHSAKSGRGAITPVYRTIHTTTLTA